MDPRSAKTVTAIKRAFIELIETNPINKISISTLCTKVGIPRQTFYYHFDDMQALVEAVVADEVNEYHEMFIKDESDFITKTVHQLHAFGKNRVLNQRLKEAGMGDVLRERLFEAAHDLFFSRWVSHNGEMPEAKAESIFRFLSAGMYEVMFNRVDGISDEELAADIKKIMESHHLIPNV